MERKRYVVYDIESGDEPMEGTARPFLRIVDDGEGNLSAQRIDEED